MKSRARATRAMTRGVNNEKLLTADSARAVKLRVRENRAYLARDGVRAAARCNARD